MTITARYFRVVKEGNPPEHNDDSAEASVERRRFAISDGAAESGFAGVWSRVLVDQFVNHADAPADEWTAWLPAAQQRWLDELRDVKIPYYGEPQFQQGSFATFLGVVISARSDSGCEWQATAVGDSCLFHVRDGELLRSFPLQESEQFGRFPKLVGSRSLVAEIVEKRAKFTAGTGQAGDRLWLMSDALAQWYLAELEAERSSASELAEYLEPSSADERFATWIDDLRASRHLQNDDVTLLGIDL